ncbi:putative DNA repair protein RadC [Veillonellaceae bacterium DNF00626]|nr:putative DNA repair protein RadC [Veillonellaceae bacterium DNF00626]
METIQELFIDVLGSSAAEKIGSMMKDVENTYRNELRYLVKEDFLSYGLTKAQATKAAAVINLANRISSLSPKQVLMRTPEKVFNHFEYLKAEEQEHFIVCFLNIKNRLLGYKEISIGNLNAAPADIKEAMRWALRFKAYGLILVHNHPSGDPEPSRADIHLTKAFAKAANLLDMTILDHLVIGDDIFVSFQERGYL